MVSPRLASMVGHGHFPLIPEAGRISWFEILLMYDGLADHGSLEAVRGCFNPVDVPVVGYSSGKTARKEC